MTPEKLQTLPEFVTLGSPQLRAFTLEYCTNGADKLAAARKAYGPKDDENAAAYANRALRNPAVRGLVNQFYGRTDELGSRDAALAILWRRINAPGVEDKLLLDFLKLWGLWNGLEMAKAPAPAPPAAPTVDDAAADEILKDLNEE